MVHWSGVGYCRAVPRKMERVGLKHLRSVRVLRPWSVGLVVLASAACGGGSSPSSPSVTAPIVATDACAAVGQDAGGLAIRNGAACSPDRSAVVRLNLRMSDGSGLGTCTGTIIAPRQILTAAHCLDGGVGIVQVWLGVVGTEQIAAQSFVLWPNFVFNSQSSYDVGVVTMAADLPRTPMSILTSRDGRVGETAIIAGWGRDQNDVSTSLRAGSTVLSAVSSGYLETLYAPPSSSVCSGDSGGPIFLSEGGAWTLAGITSATSEAVCNTGTNFYQSVRQSSVLAFILQHVPTVGRR